MRTLILLFFILFVISLPAQLSDSISLSAIEQIDLSNASPLLFQEYLDLGTSMVDEDGETGLKGELILTIASEELKAAIKSERLDPGANKVAKLIKGFAARGYLVYQPKVPDLVKGLRYCCEGRYAYVIKRLQQRGLFFPTVAVVAFLLLGFIARWLNWISWGNRRTIIRWSIAIGVVLIILILVFKLSCTQAISPDSIYGIPVQ